MYTKHRSNPWAWCAVLALAVGLSAGAARADDDPPDRVARVSFLSGSVSFQPAGDDQWSEASLNRPLGTGDKVYTDKDSRIELEIGSADIRLDQGSTFNLLNLDDDTAQIELTEGTVNLHVRRIASGQSYEIDTPTLAFVVNQPGNYRVDIAPQGDSTMVTVFDGDGDVYGENNASYSVRAGNTYRFNDSALHDYEVLDLPRGDDFDQWCSTRNQRYERSPSRQFVSEDVIGYTDLDDAGSWSTAPEYGNVWYPTTVEADWAPYRSGHWSWIDPWGWTWVDNARWGFAPFHYGRWAYIGNRWGWCPGEYRGRSIYAPALVAFVGGVGISVGGGGPVGWFPLGPREVYVPWYHGSRNYFTNINVRNTTFVNNTYITNVYNNYSRGRPITGVNYAYRGNLTAVSRDAFVGSRSVGAARVQINDRELRNAQVVSRLGVAPTQASFAGNAGRGRAAPAAGVMDRRVIARTAPPARSAPIASRIQAIERNGAQPLPASQARAIVARPGTNAVQNRAANSRVQLVGQNSTAKPQPLPARGTAAVGTQRPNVANDRGAVPGTRGPQTPTSPANVNRSPVGTPANPGANTVQRGQSNGPDRNSLPSSRFAPHTGSPANGNNAANPAVTRNAQPGANAANRNLPNSVQRGSSSTPADRGNAQTQVQRQSLPQRSNPTTDRGNTTPQQQGQIRPAPQVREIQRNNAPVQNPTRNVQQPQVQRSVQQPQVQRSVEQPNYQRSAPSQPQYQQQQRNVQQPVQQPRNVQPAQPRNNPQPQVQRNQPQPQQREQRGERGGKDKDKDKDGH
jgi:hypothetical protein